MTSVIVILLANMIGAGYCIVRLGRIYSKTDSKTLKEVTRLNIFFAACYFIIFGMRILNGGHNVFTSLGIALSVAVWPFVWTRPSVLLSKKIDEELNQLDLNERHVRTIEIKADR